MRLGLDLTPRLLLLQRCTVCKQYIDAPVGSLREDKMIQAMVGYMAYAKCPSCGHTVEDSDNNDYRKRVDRFIRRK
jgi:hypothetical protein